MVYKGRFAPSPSGPLHRGSLIAALGSFLDARANKGTWLLRIEDIDPPRENPESKRLIPKQLERHGLIWDEAIQFQSQRYKIYNEHLSSLQNSKLTYLCDCTRQRIKSLGGQYDGFCRNRNSLLDSSRDNTAIRIRFEKPAQLDFHIQWEDLIQGKHSFNNRLLGGDFILKRKDGLYSYQLAVAIDDATEGFTHIIRGEDLLDSTPRQIFIQNSLNLPTPQYGHLPLVLDQNGQKLSKQNRATSLDEYRAQENLYFALNILGQNPMPELKEQTVDKIIQWAIKHWQRSAIPNSIL